MADANIQSYDDLSTSVAKYLKRQDLAALIPDFIQLAEDVLDKTIYVVARRSSYVITPTQAVFPVPTDMKRPIRAYTNGRLLDYFPPDWESQYANGQVPQIANGYQIIGGQISLSVPQLGIPFQLDYYQVLEGLSSTNESNWLLEDAPLIYLSAVLYEAFSYVRDYEKAQYWQSKRDQTIQIYIADDAAAQRPSAPLTIRAG